MPDNRAIITFGAAGVDTVVSAAGRVKDALKSVGEEHKNIASAAVSVTQSLANLGQTALTVITAVNTLDLGRALEQTRALNDQVGRMGASGAGSVAELNRALSETSRAIGVGEPALASMSSSLGKLTHDFNSAIAAQRGLGIEALATGKSAEELQPLGAVLHNVLGVTGDTTEALGRLRAQAELMGTVGGPAAFAEQVAAAGSALEQVSMKTQEARDRATGFMAVIGHGLNPAAAGRVQQSALTSLQSHYFDINYTLGRNILDEQGHVQDPAKVIEDLKAQLGRRGLGKGQQLQAFRNFFGVEAGSSLFTADLSKVDAAAHVAPSGSAQHAASAFLEGDEGQRRQRRLQAERDQRAAAEPMLGAQDAYSSFFGGHPFLQMGASALLMGGASSLLRKAPGFVGGLFGGSRETDRAGGGLAGALGAAADAMPVRVTNWAEAQFPGMAPSMPMLPPVVPPIVPPIPLPLPGILPAVGELAAGAALPAAMALSGAAMVTTYSEQERLREYDALPNYVKARMRKEEAFAGKDKDVDRIIGLAGQVDRSNPANVRRALMGVNHDAWLREENDPALQLLVRAAGSGKGLEDLPNAIAERLAAVLRDNPPPPQVIANDTGHPVSVTTKAKSSGKGR